MAAPTFLLVRNDLVTNEELAKLPPNWMYISESIFGTIFMFILVGCGWWFSAAYMFFGSVLPNIFNKIMNSLILEIKNAN